jgi:hypothetical protein
MPAFPEVMIEYRKQLEKGAIQAAYRGLMDYIMDLKNQLKSRHPGFNVPGSIYFGYMDMTYFAFTPPALQERGLKVAIVFLHEAFRFEAWLAGANKQVQAEYWNLIKASGWNQYRLVPSIKGADAIIEVVVAGEPDFSDLDGLSRQIEAGTMKFIGDVEKFLAQQ